MKKRVSFSLLVVSVAFSGILSTGSIIQAKGKEKEPQMLMSEEYETPTFIGEKWEAPKGLNKKEIVFAYLEEKKDLFKLDGDVKDKFKIIEQESDKKTDTYHFRLVETYEGIPVYGSDQTIALDDDENVMAFFGQVIPDLEDKKIPKKAKLKEKDAIEIVEKDLKKKVGKIKEYAMKPKAELYVYPRKNKFYLAYEVKASFASPEPGYWHYFIDATNGKVIDKFNVIKEATGSGTGVFGDTKTFETTSSGGTYVLKGTSRGNGIETYDAKNQPYYSSRLPGSTISSTNNYFTDGSAVDAHKYAEEVYDYFKNTHGRNSYDNNGAKIISSVHVGSNWANAAWIGTQMVYGDGGSSFYPLAGGLDVVAHELAHAVTERTANLTYRNESGALNESMSDIFGAMVDRDDWLMGEDVVRSGDALRSLSDPTDFGDPDHYSKRYTGTADNGGVHTNSSINNKAAYLIAQGGTHYGIKVNGVGREATEKIYYRALTRYLTSSSNFAAMRQAAIQAATDLYGASSAEVTAVKNAYSAIGVN